MDVVDVEVYAHGSLSTVACNCNYLQDDDRKKDDDKKKDTDTICIGLLTAWKPTTGSKRYADMLLTHPVCSIQNKERRDRAIGNIVSIPLLSRMLQILH